MQNVILSIKQPGRQQYVGGVSTVINNYFANTELFRQNGIELSFYDYSAAKWDSCIKNSKIRNVLFGIGQIKNIKKIIGDPKATIFHIHTSREFLFFKDVILATYVKKRFRGIRVMLTIHVGNIETVYNRISFFKRCTLKLMNKYVDHIFFLSNSIMDEFCSAGLLRDKCSVLYNFHSLHNFPAPQITNIQKINMIFLGSIHREKGIMDLMSALKDLDDKIDYHLDVCGMVTDKSIEDEFNDILRRNKRITLRGYVSGAEKEDLLKNADVLVLPSYHEGLPLVILEALAAGCAIITTKVGAIPEILSDDNVVWINIGDPNSIKDAIVYLMNNQDKLQNMKLCNYQLSQNFLIDEHINKLCREYLKDVRLSDVE